MRLALTALVLLGTSVFAQPVKADPYPWCAIYGGGSQGGGESCYYLTFERCLNQIQGLGGFCNPNPRYTGPSTYRADKGHARRNARQ
jgi:hypothetical protein